MTAFEDIHARYGDFVLRICRRYAPSRDDAEDLAQETFIKVAARLDSFRRESEPGTWIYRVAVNTCLDYLRARRRRKENLEAYLDDLVVRNLDPEGDRMHAALELEEILGQFRPAVRRMLFLTLAEGLTYAEAAEVLGMTPAAVSKSVGRFLAKSRAGFWDRPAGKKPVSETGMSVSSPPAASNPSGRRSDDT